MRPSGLFVVGTDTGVGKTRVAAGIARALVASGHRVGVLKPVATGATRARDSWRCADAEELLAALDVPVPLGRVAPLIFAEPLAPTVAARRAEARPLTWDRVVGALEGAIDGWAGVGVLVVEGIGGFLTPIAEPGTVADLALWLDYPLVIVARRGLGTLNHTLLTVEAALRRGLRVAGVVVNEATAPEGTAAEATNVEALARLLPDGIPLLGPLAFGADAAALPGVGDWSRRAARPRFDSRTQETGHAP